MTTPLNVLRVAIIAALAAAFVAPAAARVPAAPAGQSVTRLASLPDTNQIATALVEFESRLKGYLALRNGLAAKLEPLSAAADAAELAARQRTLTAALREARKAAKPGDIIPPLVADEVRRVFAADLRRRDAEATRAVFQEVPNRARPVINTTMPENTALVSVPPLLLKDLPPLPDNLQYRFLGRHVVLMDGDTRIIVDYILNVLPPH